MNEHQLLHYNHNYELGTMLNKSLSFPAIVHHDLSSLPSHEALQTNANKHTTRKAMLNAMHYQNENCNNS